MKKAIFGIAVAAAALAGAYAYLIAPGKKRKYELPEKGYAHRGLWNEKRPENSLPAFEAAVKAGYGIETDVRLTADKVPVIMHDDSLERMCGDSRLISETAYADLADVKIGPCGEKIPTFEEMLDSVSGKVPLLIELKGETGDTELCDVIAPILDEYDGDFVVESFNPLLLGKMKKLRPKIVRGQLLTNVMRRKYGSRLRGFVLTNLLTDFISRPDFIAYDKKYPNGLSLNIATRLFGAGRCVWTVRDHGEYKKYIGNGETPIFDGFDPSVNHPGDCNA